MTRSPVRSPSPTPHPSRVSLPPPGSPRGTVDGEVGRSTGRDGRRAPPRRSSWESPPKTAVCIPLEPLLSGDDTAPGSWNARPALKSLPSQWRWSPEGRLPGPSTSRSLEASWTWKNRSGSWTGAPGGRGSGSSRPGTHKRAELLLSTPDDVTVIAAGVHDYLRHGGETGLSGRSSPAILLDFPPSATCWRLWPCGSWDSPHPHGVYWSGWQHLLDLLQGRGGKAVTGFRGLPLDPPHPGGLPLPPPGCSPTTAHRAAPGLPVGSAGWRSPRVSAGVLAAHLRWVALSRCTKWDVPRMRVDNVWDYRVAPLHRRHPDGGLPTGWRPPIPSGRGGGGRSPQRPSPPIPDAFVRRAPGGLPPPSGGSTAAFREGLSSGTPPHWGSSFSASAPPGIAVLPPRLPLQLPPQCGGGGNHPGAAGSGPRGRSPWTTCSSPAPRIIPGAGGPGPGEGAMEEKGGKERADPPSPEEPGPGPVCSTPGARPTAGGPGARLILLDAHAGERIVEGTLEAPLHEIMSRPSPPRQEEDGMHSGSAGGGWCRRPPGGRQGERPQEPPGSPPDPGPHPPGRGPVPDSPSTRSLLRWPRSRKLPAIPPAAGSPAPGGGFSRSGRGATTSGGVVPHQRPGFVAVAVGWHTVSGRRHPGAAASPGVRSRLDSRRNSSSRWLPPATRRAMSRLL